MQVLRSAGGGKHRSVLQRTVALFAGRPKVGPIVIVTAPERFENYRHHLIGERLAQGAQQIDDRLFFVAGGRERWESVLFGLRFLADKGPAYVAIHDAARPLCTGAVIEEAFRTVEETDSGAVPGVAEPATLKRRGADGSVTETVSRAGLFQAQTPQCFPLPRLLEGYEALLQAGRLQDVTDDAQVFERMGWPVKITEGSARNIKITTPEDVVLANAILRGDAE